VGGGYALTKRYLGLNEDIRAGEQMLAITDRLAGGCQLTRALLEAQDSGCVVTARRLDDLLTANLEAVSAGLASAGPQARAIAEACFDHIARQRLQRAPAAAHLPAGQGDLPPGAPGVRRPTLASASPGN
jgi:hypothetical protein